MTDLDKVPIGLLAAWPLLVAALIWMDRRHGRLPLFLVYAYIAGLAINHWFGGLVHAFPWKPFRSSANTIEGFTLSTWGLAFLILGAALVPGPSLKSPRASSPAAYQTSRKDGPRIAKLLLIIGMLSWVAELSPLADLPSISAVIGAGKQMLIAGICLKCWLAWKDGNKRAFFAYLALGFAFPVYTVLMQGFLSYGISFVMTILIFVGAFYRPRWQVFAGSILAIYAGLSTYIGYTERRAEIRAAVWYGEGQRLDAFSSMVDAITPFDPENPRHLILVDARLNQNELVGKSMGFVPTSVDFAYGETLYMALIALVPRAIWPDKPVSAGGMGLVSLYTGLEFGHITSVGMGQVMEFYVNFGWFGVAAGFFALGIVLRLIDTRIAVSIVNENWRSVGLWFAVGVSALQPIGQLVEITSSMAAAAVAGLLIWKLWQRSRRRPAASAS